MENVEGKENAVTFLDLASAKELKSLANENTKAVVIGAGLIGMKAAEGLVKICKSVDVVELAPRVLPSILDKTSARQVKSIWKITALNSIWKILLLRLNQRVSILQV